MAWSFKKRKRIAPGVHLNFSKKGVSTSFGVKGFSITMGRRGTYLNTSIPGTGIYNRQKLSNGTQKTLVGSSAPDNTRKEQKNDEKDWLKIFLKVLLAVNLLAFIGGIILYVDDKETFSPMELFSMIFCAIISVACIIGLRELRKKALRDLGRKMGKDIVEQLLEKVEVDKKANEKKNL